MGVDVRRRGTGNWACATVNVMRARFLESASKNQGLHFHESDSNSEWQNTADRQSSSHIILGVYLIIFGAVRSFTRTRQDVSAYNSTGTALLEFQIPQQVARYASFMFSFLGRGICKRIPTHVSQFPLTARSLRLHRMRHCW